MLARQVVKVLAVLRAPDVGLVALVNRLVAPPAVVLVLLHALIVARLIAVHRALALVGLVVQMLAMVNAKIIVQEIVRVLQQEHHILLVRNGIMQMDAH